VTYNILAIRSPSDPFDPLYPNLNEGGKGFRPVGNDGKNIRRWPVLTMSVWEDRDDTYHRIGSFNDGTPTLFLTDIRVVVVHHSFNTGDRSYAMWGMDASYLTSVALARLRTYNRALTGHLPLISLSRISVKPADGRPHGIVRLFAIEKTGGAPRTVILQFSLKSINDALDFAQGTARRSARVWLRGSKEPRALLEKLTEAARLEPADGTWSSYRLPCTAHLDEDIPARLGIKPPGA